MLYTIGKYYLKFSNFLCPKRGKESSVTYIRFHLLIAITLITGILMWLYATYSLLWLEDEAIKYMGLVYAAIHIMSPVVLRKTRSLTLSTYCMLIPGGFFQCHFSWVTGGYFTTTLIWVGILPLIAGILTSKKHTIIWALIAVAATVSFAIFRSDYPAGKGIADQGLFFTQSTVVFGMILLNSVFTLSLLYIESKVSESLEERLLDKQNLLRVLVHDIANPLTVVSFTMNKVLKLIEKNNLNSTDLSKGITSVKRISSILETVRVMEAIESGKVKLDPEPHKIVTLVNNCLNLLSNRITDKKITIQKEISDDLIVYTQATIFENQILMNFLTNAIKFTPIGGAIKISANRNDEKNIFISIQDQGPGIPDNILDKLFDPSAKTTRVGSNGEKGTGFGMPIAMKFAKTLGAQITVSTTVANDISIQSGTTFRITFASGNN